jgi:prephenate dehydrogenase
MNNTVGIAGLGLIGGSLAKAIKARTGCRVLGCDIREDVVAQAMEQGAIDGELTDATLAQCGLVIVALYPDDVITWCEEHFAHMREGTIVVDCAGIKTKICATLPPLAQAHGLRFVGGHPMAGIERSGFANSDPALFDGAAMILCEDGCADRAALEELRLFFLFLGFGTIKITTAREHDEVIAYTSQLAHIVSSAYIRSDTAKRRSGFSAGSFKDLTRVAELSEDMWTALFFGNRENLLREADAFMEHLRMYRDALAAADRDAMRELLRSGTALKIADEEEEEKWRKK